MPKSECGEYISLAVNLIFLQFVSFIFPPKQWIYAPSSHFWQRLTINIVVSQINYLSFWMHIKKNTN